MRIAMIGSGYVGLVSGACFADFGHEVVCVDKDPAKIEALEGRPDPDLRAGPRGARRRQRAAGPPELHHRSRRRRRRAPTRSSSRSARRPGAATALPTSPTSTPRPARSPQRSTGYTVVVTKSTVPVGTGDEVERIIREARPDAEFAVVSNPEFLREGAAIEDFKRPDRIVIGAEDERAARGHARGLPAALPQPGADPGHGPAHGRADEIRRQRLPRHQDHLHQRDRGPLRAGRRQRAGGRARHRPRQPHRRASSCMPARATAAPASPRTRSPWSRPRRMHGTPVRLVETVVAVNDQRKRAMARKVIAACGGSRARQDRSRSSASPSSPTPTTCATRPSLVDHHGACRTAGAAHPRLRPRGHGPGAGASCSRRRPTPSDAYACAEGADAAGASSPNGTPSARSTSTACRAAHGRAGRGRPAQRLPPRGRGTAWVPLHRHRRRAGSGLTVAGSIPRRMRRGRSASPGTVR